MKYQIKNITGGRCKRREIGGGNMEIIPVQKLLHSQPCLRKSK